MREVRPCVCLGWAASDARLTMRDCAAGAEPETRDWRVESGLSSEQTGDSGETGRGAVTGLRNASQSASANGKPKMLNNI